MEKELRTERMKKDPYLLKIEYYQNNKKSISCRRIFIYLLFFLDSDSTNKSTFNCTKLPPLLLYALLRKRNTTLKLEDQDIPILS